MKVFDYNILIPIKVTCSQREDGSISIDAIKIPDEDKIYELVDREAHFIKEIAEDIIYDKEEKRNKTR